MNNNGRNAMDNGGFLMENNAPGTCGDLALLRIFLKVFFALPKRHHARKKLKEEVRVPPDSSDNR